jgi:monoamine oxidase
MVPKYDVIIVGAGAAGLTAGRMLAEANLRVAILEARNRVGGRILTQHIVSPLGGAPAAVEMGAEFIHGLPRISWALAEEARLPAYELDGAELSFANGRWLAQGTQPGDSHRVLEEMIDWLASRPAGFDMPFAEYLRLRSIDAASAAAATAYVEGFNAADRGRIGIASLAKQQRAEDAIDADRLFRIATGYDALPAFLNSAFERAGGELMLEACVHKVEWRRDAVSIHARNAAAEALLLHASRALITVPLGVLQADAIDFVPRPADILEHARRMAMGPVVRIVLVFRHAFWRQRRESSIPAGVQRKLENLSFLFTPSEVPSTWWTPAPENTPMLTAWVGGRDAAGLLRPGDRPALLAQCLSTLGKVFDLAAPALRELLLSWHMHDWSADEFARGAYSYVPAGALDAPERMTHPVNETIYFAGEHTDMSGHWGTVHAALESGSRAASQLLESLGGSASPGSG